MQKTLSQILSFTGPGLHSGAKIVMTVAPAAADTGIIFVRSDVSDRDNRIPALWDHVSDTRLCSVISNAASVSVGTIEHLMAALRGMEIDNAVITLDGPEVPVMDGSALPFVKAFAQAGIEAQSAVRRAIRVLKDVKVQDGDKWVSLSPAAASSFAGAIDFSHPEIGSQSFNIALVNGNFMHDLADCRTFGFLHEVEYLRSQGLALGGSLENAIVLDRDKILNKDGLRRGDEFIRHKLLDAVGDLYLAGMPIIGAYDSFKPGHDLNNRLLHALFADSDAWEVVEMPHFALSKENKEFLAVE